MRITIFGGSGETGLLVIKKALAEGHSVTAFARTPSKIAFQNEKLTVVKGELDEADKIEAAVKDADAVISVLGPTGKTKGQAISVGIKNIITAMEKHAVKRLIATATPSSKDSHDKFQLSFNIAVFMVQNLMKDVYNDIITLGENITQSRLDWTLLRLPMLSSKPATGKINIGYTGDGKVKLFSLTREDLAVLLIQQLDNKEYIKKAPVVSN
ncbi:NAD(P)-dependent oxidoreductase [Mucilaginibacter arboris]|uniref:NAD(P)H-binding protein n=1 Tax=Mucilaginibacter arboris TaxID=2682090 RepID=A0A7K1T1J6_9SPHI|nr:NAD(P)H-binding protein [Mucilaginibacter arboris]MVN23150.1 NAD(P)H-binding protein [Mucilaginibacter arboris]